MCCFPLWCYPACCLSAEDNYQVGLERLGRVFANNNRTQRFGQQVPGRSSDLYFEALTHFKAAAAKGHTNAEYEYGLLLVSAHYDERTRKYFGVKEASRMLELAFGFEGAQAKVAADFVRKVNDVGLQYLQSAEKKDHPKAGVVIREYQEYKGQSNEAAARRKRDQADRAWQATKYREEHQYDAYQARADEETIKQGLLAFASNEQAKAAAAPPLPTIHTTNPVFRED